MHILFKRWDIRALSSMDLSHQKWKEIELSFIPHKPDPEGPSNEGSDCLGSDPPMFDGKGYGW